MKSQIFKSKNELAFYILMAAFPVAQLVVFYFIVNGNAILLSFREYNSARNGFEWSIAPFAEAVRQFGSKAMLTRVANSLIMYGISLLVILPLSLFFSYYIYRKERFSDFFRTMLFIPSVISPIIMTMLYSYFVDRAWPELIEKMFHIQTTGILSGLDTQFGGVLFYNVLIGFGVQILMYANSMSGINVSITESCKLDGANNFQEFYHIVLPSIWPTLTTFLVVGIAGIFTNQLNLIGFFGTNADVNVQSLGYYLFAQVTVASNAPGGVAEYPLLSALGLLMTLVAVPLTFCVKYILQRFGPSEDERKVRL